MSATLDAEKFSEYFSYVLLLLLLTSGPSCFAFMSNLLLELQYCLLREGNTLWMSIMPMNRKKIILILHS